LHFLREDELPVGREASPPDELIFRELVKERLGDPARFSLSAP